MTDYMTDLSTDSLSIRLTVVPQQHGKNLVAVDAATDDGRRAVVVWERDGTGHPVVDDLTEAESDAECAAGEKHMLANNLWNTKL